MAGSKKENDERTMSFAVVEKLPLRGRVSRERRHRVKTKRRGSTDQGR